MFGRWDMLDHKGRPNCLAAKQTQEQQTTPTSSIYHILRIAAIRPGHDESSNFPTSYNIDTSDTPFMRIQQHRKRLRACINVEYPAGLTIPPPHRSETYTTLA
jgi:hypothetical protein